VIDKSLVCLSDIWHAYDGGKILALRGVSLSLHPGESLSILGPSGSGKTTILNLMSGLDQPTRGQVFYDGEEIRSPARWSMIRARHVGYVFQAFHLLPTLSAIENVELPMFGVVRSHRERTQRARTLLERVGMADRMDQDHRKLSGGERQRVAIARSLANDPRLILADEPTGNLDSENAAKIMEFLMEIQEERQAALVIITHEKAIARCCRR
jgi:putative ABC transport system ATP-binding protein